MKLNYIKELFKGKFLGLYIANYTSNEGRNKDYEVISRPLESKDDLMEKANPDAVTIICYNKDRTKMLIQKEFRMTINDFVWDFPSGLIDEGETPRQTAIRELKEETGLDLVEFEAILPPCYTSVGMSNETVVPVYCIAEGQITGSDSDLEETEPVWISKEDAKRLLKKSISAVENRKPFIRFSNRVSSEIYRWVFED